MVQRIRPMIRKIYIFAQDGLIPLIWTGKESPELDTKIEAFAHQVQTFAAAKDAQGSLATGSSRCGARPIRVKRMTTSSACERA